MDQLWAPWRLDYICGEKPDGCIFCVFPQCNEDEKTHILHRGKQAFVIMNAFPYSNGHLLITPYRHIGDPCDLTEDENRELMQLVQMSCRVLRAVCGPEGFNIGINAGTAAGAGIADHIHVHVVPRWSGDTSFMTALAGVKVIPEDLDTTYAKLKAAFDELAEKDDG